VDVSGEHAPGEERLVLLRSIGGIGPNARGGVLLADEVGQSRPIMGIGGARIPGADQSVDPIDADMVFIAKHRNGQIDRFCRLGIGTFPDLGLGIFDRPARITVFLPDLRSAATSGPRNSSKSTTAAKRSSGSPAALSASYRSERSKKPGCPAITVPFQVTMTMNQLSASNARFFEPSSCAAPFERGAISPTMRRPPSCSI